MLVFLPRHHCLWSHYGERWFICYTKRPLRAHVRAISRTNKEWLPNFYKVLYTRVLVHKTSAKECRLQEWSLGTSDTALMTISNPTWLMLARPLLSTPSKKSIVYSWYSGQSSCLCLVVTGLLRELHMQANSMEANFSSTPTPCKARACMGHLSRIWTRASSWRDNEVCGNIVQFCQCWCEERCSCIDHSGKCVQI